MKNAIGGGTTAEGNIVAALNTGDTICIYLNVYTTYGINSIHSNFTGFRIGP